MSYNPSDSLGYTRTNKSSLTRGNIKTKLLNQLQVETFKRSYDTTNLTRYGLTDASLQLLYDNFNIAVNPETPVQLIPLIIDHINDVEDSKNNLSDIARSGNINDTHGDLPHARISGLGALASRGTVGTSQIEDGAVSWSKIQDGAVTGTKLADSVNLDAILKKGNSSEEELIINKIKCVDLNVKEAMFGGGHVRVNSTGYVKWDLIKIPIYGRFRDFSSQERITVGKFDIVCPTSGDISLNDSATGVTAGTNGIPLAAGQSLYYKLNGVSYDPGNFKVVDYEADAAQHSWSSPSSDHILICARHPTEPYIHWFPTKQTIEFGKSINTDDGSFSVSGTITAGSFSGTISANDVSGLAGVATGGNLSSGKITGNFNASRIDAGTLTRPIQTDSSDNRIAQLKIDNWIKHHEDEDTYVGFPAAEDTFTITTGGVERVKIDSTGLTWGGSTLVIDSNGNISSSRISGLGVLASRGTVDTNQIEDGAVTTAKITNSAVTAAKIADGAVTDAKIVGLSYSKLSDAPTLGALALLGTVGTNQITNSAVTTAKIADGAVTTAKITNSAVTTAKIANGVVTEAKIADSAVTDAKIDGLSYSKLSGAPTIPTDTGDLTNNAGFITASALDGKLDTTGTAANSTKLNNQVASYYLNYNNFTNTPTIPTNTNQLTNGAGYLTSSSTISSDKVSGSNLLIGRYRILDKQVTIYDDGSFDTTNSVFYIASINYAGTMEVDIYDWKGFSVASFHVVDTTGYDSTNPSSINNRVFVRSIQEYTKMELFVKDDGPFIHLYARETTSIQWSADQTPNRNHYFISIRGQQVVIYETGMDEIMNKADLLNLPVTTTESQSGVNINGTTTLGSDTKKVTIGTYAAAGFSPQKFTLAYDSIPVIEYYNNLTVLPATYIGGDLEVTGDVRTGQRIRLIDQDDRVFTIAHDNGNGVGDFHLYDSAGSTPVLGYFRSQGVLSLIQDHSVGKVGVGTDTPRNNMDVYGSNGLTISSSVTGAPRTSVLRLGRPYATNHDAYCAKITSTNNPAQNYNSDLRFYTSSGNNQFATECMCILSGGRVGIGTGAPHNKLHIKGDRSTTHALDSDPSRTDWGQFILSSESVNSSLSSKPLDFKIAVDEGTRAVALQGVYQWTTSAVNLLLNPVGGNVGIGTTTPDSKLDVNGTVTASRFLIDSIAALTKPAYVVGETSGIGYRFLWDSIDSFGAAVSDLVTIGNVNLPEMNIRGDKIRISKDCGDNTPATVVNIHANRTVIGRAATNFSDFEGSGYQDNTVYTLDNFRPIGTLTHYARSVATESEVLENPELPFEIYLTLVDNNNQLSDARNRHVNIGYYVVRVRMLVKIEPNPAASRQRTTFGLNMVLLLQGGLVEDGVADRQVKGDSFTYFSLSPGDDPAFYKQIEAEWQVTPNAPVNNLRPALSDLQLGIYMQQSDREIVQSIQFVDARFDLYGA